MFKQAASLKLGRCWVGHLYLPCGAVSQVLPLGGRLAQAAVTVAAGRDQMHVLQRGAQGACRQHPALRQEGDHRMHQPVVWKHPSL